MRRRVAEKIQIKNEIKNDFVREGDLLTEKTYSYKEVLVFDKDDNLLELFRVNINVESEEDFFKETGVMLGLSTWIQN